MFRVGHHPHSQSIALLTKTGSGRGAVHGNQKINQNAAASRVRNADHIQWLGQIVKGRAGLSGVATVVEGELGAYIDEWFP